MQYTEAPKEAVYEAQARAVPSFRLVRRLARRRLALIALAVIAVIYLAGILAPWLAPYSFTKPDFENTFAGPSLDHPFGTDRLGRDMLSRVMWSAQTTVIVSAAAMLTGGLALGVTLGLLSGYAGGRLDNLIMRIGDAFYAVPTILLLIIISATLRKSVENFFRDVEDWTGIDGIVSSGAPSYVLVFGALSLFGWVGMARLVRSQVLALRETDYVLAARAAGAEVALTWLGIGIQPPHPSFGVMIFDGSGLTNLRTHPNLLLVPSAVLAALMLSFNLLGDVLTDVLSPRRR